MTAAPKKSDFFFKRSPKTFIYIFIFWLSISLVSWLSLVKIKQQIDKDLKNNMQTVMKTAKNATDLWVANQFDVTSLLAQNQIVRSSVAELSSAYAKQKDLKNNPAIVRIRDFLKPWLTEKNALEFFIISHDGVCLASMSDSSIGTVLPLTAHNIFFQKSFEGNPHLILPLHRRIDQKQDPDKTKEYKPSMFVTVPVFNQGIIAAVLAVHIDPSLDFSSITRLDRPEKKGNFYFFNDKGYRINTGILDPAMGLSLPLRISDPGGDMTKGFKPDKPMQDMPLTYLAQEALAGSEGINIEGYRDYRGVKVIGIWSWDQGRNFCMAYEVDFDEAYLPYNTIRSIVLVAISLIIFLFSTVLIILERKKIQAVETSSILKHKDKMLLAMTDSVIDAIVMIDNEDRVRFWNSSAETMFGYTKEEAINQPLHKLIMPECYHAQMIESFKTFKNTGKGPIIGSLQEVRASRKDGTEFPAEILVNALKQDDKWWAVGAIRDISKRKHKEKTLQKLEDALAQLEESQAELLTLSSAVEASPVSVVVTDPEGLIEYVNRKFTEVTGYTSDEVVGKNPNILKSGEHPDSFYKDLWQELTKGNEWHGEFCNKKKDGTIFWERASISPILNERGERIHYVGVKEDITDKKKDEKELQEALAQAKEATIAKSDFVANMSHEIRTPMNAVIGMCHLALQTELTPRQHDYLQNIKSSAKSLLTIINDILDFSKIEAGKMTIEQTMFSLSDVLDDVVMLSAGHLAGKGVELIIDLDENIPNVLIGDPVRLGQIFNNLLSNAAKFTEQGEVEIKVKITDKQLQFVSLECTIADTGIGMSKEQSTKLFKKFTQADATTTRKYGGTGLGLAICWQLIELMGGKIKVYSTPGKGSRFVFSLTLAHQADRRKTENMRILPLNLRNLKVLLIEGNKKNSERIKKQLESFSFQVDTSQECNKACDYLDSALKSKNPYELMIIDFHLSKQYDFKVSKIISLNPSFSQLPIIIMATVNDIAEAEEFIKTQKLSCVLTKPATPSRLFNSIVEAFGYGDLVIEKRRVIHHAKLNDLKQIRGSKVLLVEDNKFNQQVALELLKKVGIQVYVVNNGQEALDIVQQKNFDIVLMDIQMPIMDGLTASVKIRELTSPPVKIPIIAMTAHAMAGDREKSLAAGMNDHLTKPISPDQLYECLLRWISHKSHHDFFDNSTQLKLSSSRAEISKKINFPDKIPGLDVTSGLKIVSGNKELFINLLKNFSDEHKYFPDEIKNSLAQNNYEKAARKAHTLKGIAGSIGALDLQGKAMVLETALNKKSENIINLLNDTEISLRFVLKNIQDVLLKLFPNKPENNLALENIDNESLANKLIELRKLLEVNNMKSEEIFHEIKDTLYIIHPYLTAKMEQYLESLNFKSSLEVLEKIEKEVQSCMKNKQSL